MTTNTPELVAVWSLSRGDQFCVPGDPRTWTFRSMDGGYCYATDEAGDTLNMSGKVLKLEDKSD